MWDGAEETWNAWRQEKWGIGIAVQMGNWGIRNVE